MKRYALIVDIIAIIPIFRIYSLTMFSKNAKTFVLLFKLSKSLHLPRIVLEIYEHKNIHSAWAFVGYIIAFYLITHFFACIMYYFIVEKYTMWKSDNNSIDINMIWIPPSYRNIEIDENDSDFKNHTEMFFESSTMHKFSLILYSITFVIKGGEFGPITKEEAIIASIFLFLGMIVMAAIVGHIASIIEDMFNETKDYEDTLDQCQIK